MEKQHRYRGELGRALLGALLVAGLLVVLAACTRPSPPTLKKTSGRSGIANLGPYPMGVSVGIGRLRFTLIEVRVQNASATAGPFILKPSGGPPQYAPAGTRFVDVTLRVDDPAQAYATGGDPFRNPVVIADGTSVPVGARARVSAVSEPYVFREEMEFAVPLRARSAILRLPMTVETTTVLSFRLW